MFHRIPELLQRTAASSKAPGLGRYLLISMLLSIIAGLFAMPQSSAKTASTPVAPSVMASVQASAASTPASNLGSPIIETTAASSSTYTFKPGDTYSKVFGPSWEGICNANRAVTPDCNVVFPGETITVSSGPQLQTTAASTPVAPPASAAAATAVRVALAQRGKPYAWGAAGPGSFDCSGLVEYAYKAAGISLPHSSSMQSRMGTPVSRDALQPGDLVFFYSPVSHVGIYIGNGEVVHAPTFGDVVKITPIAYMPFNSARRVA